jgi:hypothetical protein
MVKTKREIEAMRWQPYNFGFDIRGMELVSSVHMTRTEEDWSKVRSPGRAARRLRQGHRQNIRVLEVPRMDFISLDGKKLIGHPEAIKALNAQIAREIDAQAYRTMAGVLP